MAAADAASLACVYEQIASNRRRTVIYLVLFFAFWCGIGVAVGELAAYRSGSVAPLVVGGVLAGLAAVIGILYTFASGASLVLSVSGAKLADPVGPLMFR